MNRTSHRLALRSGRNAFTLLELLLAIGLSLALLAAVSTSLLNYYRWRDAGERQVENARTRIVWTTMLANDLAQIPPLDLEFDRQLDASGATFRTGATVGVEQVLDLGLDFALDPLTLYGEGDFMAIGQMVPTLSKQKLGRANAPLQHQVTLWTTNDSSKWKVPQVDTSGKIVFHTVGGGRAPRFRLPPLSREDQAASVSLHRAVLHLVKPIEWAKHSEYPDRLESLSFRYFNGSDWLDHWNSHESQSLPVAIRATFKVRDSEVETNHEFRLVETRKANLSGVARIPMATAFEPGNVSSRGTTL